MPTHEKLQWIAAAFYIASIFISLIFGTHVLVAGVLWGVGLGFFFSSFVVLHSLDTATNN